MLLKKLPYIGVKPEHNPDTNTRNFFMNVDILVGFLFAGIFLILAKFTSFLPNDWPIYIACLAFLPVGKLILWLNYINKRRLSVLTGTIFTVIIFSYLTSFYGEKANFQFYLIVYGFTPFIYLGDDKESALSISLLYILGYILLILTDFQLFPTGQASLESSQLIKQVNNWFLFINAAHRFYMIYSIYLKSQENLLQRHQETEKLLSHTQLLNQELKAKKTYLNEILESPRDLIIFSLDKNYRYKAFNKNHFQTMKAIWGVEIQVGYSMLDYIKLEADRIKAQQNFDRALNGEEFTLEEEYGSDELKRSFYEDFYCPQKSPDGSIEGLTVFVKDITDRKIVQKAISQKNEQLQKYIDSNLQLENFAYAASHDLREPLRTIVSFSQLLSRKAADKLSTKELDYLNFIVTATKNLEVLINDMLTYSRVNTQKHELQQVNMKHLLGLVTSALHETIKASNAKITLGDLPEQISADPTKLRQLFQNLLSNAIKFHPNETSPQIIIKACAKPRHWHFSIIDNGIGIDPDFHHKIFLIFRRLHPRTIYEGSGIGLAICKKIVEQHEGEIWVESPNQNQGTTFHFTLKKQLKKH